MCSQNTGKIAKGYTFLITITENWGISFSRNCLWLEFNCWNDWGYKRILRNRWKHNEFNFSCEPCTKYVGKPFTRHSIWSRAKRWTKSHGTRERFTNLYMVNGSQFGVEEEQPVAWLCCDKQFSHLLHVAGGTEDPS